jgi:hypothetical protein
MTLDCVSAVKETFGVAGRGLHVMALLQGTKMLFGPLLDGLDGVSAVQEAMELQVEACMKEEDKVAADTITQAPSARARTSLRLRGPWLMRPLRCSCL